MKNKIKDFFNSPNRYLLYFALKYVFFIGVWAWVWIFFATEIFKTFFDKYWEYLPYINYAIFWIIAFEMIFFFFWYYFSYKDLKKYNELLKKDTKNSEFIKFQTPMVDLNNFSLKKKIFIIFSLIIWFCLTSFTLSQLSAKLIWVQEQWTAIYFFAMWIWVSLFIAWTLAAIEELIMRKALQEFFEKIFFKLKFAKLYVILPIIFTALAFALLHNQGKYNILIFVLGLVLSIIYFVFRNIKLNIAIHVVNNFIWILLIFLTIWNAPEFKMPEVKSETLNSSIWFLEKIFYVQEIKSGRTKEEAFKDQVLIRFYFKYDIFFNKRIMDYTLEKKSLTKEEFNNLMLVYENRLKALDKNDFSKDSISKEIYEKMYSNLNSIKNNPPEDN